MDKQIELALKRGRLQERIAGQRSALAAQMQPVAAALARVDQGIAIARTGAAYVKRHPLQVGLVVALLALSKPRRILRWGRRAFVVWGLWQKIRPQVESVRGLLQKRPA